MDKQAVLEILRSNVDRTKEEYNRSKERFLRDATGVPTGLPHPDGALRVELAARAQSAAAVAYANALRRFNQFFLDGAIPEDLAESASSTACSR
ncbi:MAG TPA: hypothetical protein VK789_07610 [Bryobacteraceae bacterium]|jgi:hypothetical protein|nr:hypothetical protein [Bryobacteraceae bacterium]